MAAPHKGTKKEQERAKKRREKAKAKAEKIKSLEAKLKRSLARNEILEADNKTLKILLDGNHVANHKYSDNVIFLCIQACAMFNISYRASSQLMQSLAALKGEAKKRISPSTIRNWCLRYGLSKLYKEVKSGDYALIMDESVTIGQQVLLAILLVPIDGLQSRISPLEIKDTMVLFVGAAKSWNSELVSQIIKVKIAQMGLNIKYGVTDNCSMLKKTLVKCGILRIPDITHMIANAVKKLYAKDEVFNNFIKKLNLTRAKWSKSQYVAFIPPAIRKKARFHQVLTVYEWAEMILKNWEELPKGAKEELEYVYANKELIQSMKCIQMMVSEYCKVFKSIGISQETAKVWNKRYEKKCKKEFDEQALKEPKLLTFKQTLENYITTTVASLGDNTEAHICTSDVIESIFGKYKHQGLQKEITDDILKIPIYASDVKIEDIAAAFGQISTKEMLQWKKENTTDSLKVIRKNMNKKKAA